MPKPSETNLLMAAAEMHRQGAFDVAAMDPTDRRTGGRVLGEGSGGGAPAANQNTSRPVERAMEAAKQNQPKSAPMDPALQKELHGSFGKLLDATKADVVPFKGKP